MNSTSAWSAVVHAIVQSQEELVSGEPAAKQAFARWCSEDEQLRTNLDRVCEHGLHDLLLSWIMEGVRERISTHAVPAFWQHYREAVGGSAMPHDWRDTGLQRRCQAAFFAAVQELAHYVGGLIQLVAIVDGRQWHAAAEFAAAWSEHSAAAAAGPPPLPHPFPETARCIEVVTLLQACVLAQAPDASTFSQWLTVCWKRSFADISRPRTGGDDDGDGGDDEEDEEAAAWDEDEDEDEEGDGMVVDDRASSPLPPAAEPLRLCCAALHQLGWLPLVEPTLSALLHLKLHASLRARCAERFDERLLSRVLSWLRRGVPRWLARCSCPTCSRPTLRRPPRCSSGSHGCASSSCRASRRCAYPSSST